MSDRPRDILKRASSKISSSHEKKLGRILKSEKVIFTLLVLSLAGGAAVSQGLDLNSGGSGLQVHYRFDQGAGDTVYDTASDWDAQRGNSSSFSRPEWVEGRNEKALNFTGKELVDLPSSGGFFDDSFDNRTYTMWVRPREVSSDQGYTVLDEGGGVNGVNVYFNDSKVYVGAWSEGNGWDGAWHNASVEAGEWHFITLRYSPQNFSASLDGELIGSTSPGADMHGHVDDDALGKVQSATKTPSGNDPGHLKGKIDEIRIYSERLKDEQISALQSGGALLTGREEKAAGGEVLEIGFTRKNSTHVFDTSGEENHGSPKNGASQESAVHCKVGRCYSFDGSNDFVEVNDNPNFDWESSLTVSAWAYVDSWSQDGAVVGKSSGSSSEPLLWSDSTNNNFAWAVNTADGFCKIDSTSFNRDAKKWYYLTGVYNGSKVTLFVDGVKVASEKTSCGGSVSKSSSDLFLGQSEGGGKSLEGRIDQVKVYDKALSQQEIIENTRKLESSGAVLDMRFDSGGGDIAFDYSGNSNNGRLKPDEELGPEWAAQGLNFGKSDSDYVDLGDNFQYKDNESFSINFWVKAGVIDQNDRVLGFDTTSAWGFLYDNFDDADGDLIFRYNSNTLNFDDLTADHEKWRMITLVHDGEGGLTGYVNSANQVTKTGASWNAPDDLFLIGDTGSGSSCNWCGGPDNFDGELKSFKIYPYAISSSKVQELYSQGSSRIGGKSSESSQPQSPGDEGLVLDQSFDRVEECGLSDTVSCPSGVSGEVAVDESGEGRHAELFSDLLESGSAGCKVSGCLDFDGSDDYLNVTGYKGVSGTQARTVSLWYKSDVSGGEDHRLLSWGNSSTGYKYVIRTDDDNSDSLRVENQGGQMYGSVDVMDREWHHLTVVLPEEGDSVQDHRLYVDGQLDNQTGGGDQSLDTASDSDVQIGRGAFSGQPTDGRIDEVKIYNRSLSENEIWSLYSQGRDRKGSDEMAGPSTWWRMNQETNPLYDMAGDNNGETNLLGEVGSFNTSDGEWKEIKFDRSYYDPVIVGTTNTQNGEPGLVFEVRNVDNSSAEMRLCESEGNSFSGCDIHGTERAGYLVIDSRGANQLSGIEAGTTSVSGGINSNTETVTFDENFGSKPIVFFTPQNDSGARPVEVWPDSTPTADQVTFGICHQDSSVSEDGCVSDHPAQEVGWVALSPGNIPFDQKAETNSLGSFGASSWQEAIFSSSFNTPPVTLFEVQDDSGGQDSKIDEAKNITSTSGWVRFCEIDGPDTCDGHANMEYGYAAFEEGILTTSQAGNFPSFVEGKTGRALEFDGSDDYLNITSGPDFTENESFSASIWVDSDLDCTSNRMDLISMVDPVFLRCDDRSDSGFGSPGNTFSSGLHFEARSSADGNYYVAESGSLDRSGWNHITGVYNGSAIKIYENGKLQDSVAVEGIYQENGSFTLGSSGTSNYFDGTVDDVRIYPYALSKEQVRQVYNGGGVSVR